MSPSPGDEQQPQEAKSTGGGLAGVFKGLTSGTKLTKSPPVIQQPFAPIVGSPSLAEQSDATSIPSGLSQEQLQLVSRLKNGQLNDRVAAANSLRYAIADFPLNPVGVESPCLLGPVSQGRC